MSAENNRGILDGILSHLKVVNGPDNRGEYIAWCPFHPDGQGKPPHNPNLYVSERGFICHACGVKGGLKKLAAKLNVATDSNSFSTEKIYDYCDADGQLIYQVVRQSGKKFRFRQPDGKGDWVWNVKGVERILYKLPDLLSKPGEIVFIVEGEKDADRLASEGLAATTNSGGAGKWRDEYNSSLEGRDVVLIPDNDTSGRSHAKIIAHSLNGIARSIKFLELPGLSEKGDVSDWLNSNHNVEELVMLASNSPDWKPADGDETEDITSCIKPKKKESFASMLLTAVTEAGVEFFHDEREEPYGAVGLQKGRRIIHLESKVFRNWLSRLAWKKTGHLIGSEGLNSIQHMLCGKARFDCPEIPLHVRSAKIDNKIWLDLDGYRAVCVSPGKWEILANPPIIFRSFSHQRPLPEPIAGSDPWRIIEFMNLQDDDDVGLLVMCYLVAVFNPDIPVVSLIVNGITGSAKTTFLKLVKAILDPSQVEVRGSIPDRNEFAQAASQNRALFFDNLSTLPDWFSDALCRAVTGEGWTKRTLYTNEDSTLFRYRIAIGMSGINMIAENSDLLDRSLVIPLNPISREQQREEDRLLREFDQTRPYILGGILDALAKTMAIEPALQLAALPRMADFARWGAAAAQALGRSPGEFLCAFDKNIERQNEAAIDSSPVAQVIIAIMAECSSWIGTPSELLAKLETYAATLRINIKSRYWPTTPTWLTRRIHEVQVSLLAIGIEITEERKSTKRLVAIRRIVGSPSSSHSK